MNPLEKLIDLPAAEKQMRGLLHTPQEIARQSALWPVTVESVRRQSDALGAFLQGTGVHDSLPSPPTVYLVGAGTSDYIGRCLEDLLRKEWQCDVKAISSTTLLTNFTDHIIPVRRYLWISFSRSGDSPEGVAVLERALEEHPHIFHLVVSCNAAGAMTQIVQGRENCFSIVLGEETNDRGLAMTASFSNMLICGHALAHLWTFEKFELVLEEMCSAAEAFLPIAASAADRLSAERYSRACFVGSGAMAGVASESALKLLELTAGNVKTMSETVLGLRHGPMAALDKKTLLILFLSTDGVRRRYEIDLLREIEEKDLVGACYAVNGAGTCNLVALDSTELIAPSRDAAIPDQYRPVVDVLFGQCLGLFSSLQYDLAPDSPSPNGAISRVVQPIQIY